MIYRLTCLICGEPGECLVKIQEHVMDEHGYTQEHLRQNTKRAIVGGFIYTMPDGVDWLRSDRIVEMICAYCKEPVTASERSPNCANAPMHEECAFRGIMGSVAHQEHRCGCFVPGSVEGDPPGLTLREAAAAALYAWRRMQYAIEKARSN